MIKRIIEDDEGWIAYLNHEIDKEMTKASEEQDWNRIEEYLQALEEVCKGIFDPDLDKKEEKINELRDLYHKAGKKKSVTFKHSHRWPGAIAACLVIMILSIPVASAAIYHLSPADIIRRWGSELFNIPYDVPVEESGITIVRRGSVKEYATIEELFDGENINILYPTWLPENVYIKKVLFYSQGDPDRISFVFSEKDISYSVDLDCEQNEAYKDIMDSYVEIEGKAIESLVIVEDDEYTVIFIDDGIKYSIQTHDERHMKSIIKGLRRR